MEAAQQQRRELAEVSAGRQKAEVCSVLLPKAFNLDTYKFHALSDYITMIKSFIGIITGRGNPPGSRSGYCSGPGGGMVSNTCAVPIPVVRVVRQRQRTSVLG